MIRYYLQISQRDRNRILSQSLIISFLSAISLVCGVTPDLSATSPTQIFSISAHAQAVSDDEVVRFARAALAIEKRRRSVVEDIKNRTGGNVPKITCDPPAQIEALDNSIRNDVRSFCDFSRQAIQDNQLTVGRFLQIRSSQDDDPTLKQRIDRELLRLQSGS